MEVSCDGESWYDERTATSDITLEQVVPDSLNAPTTQSGSYTESDIRGRTDDDANLIRTKNHSTWAYILLRRINMSAFDEKIAGPRTYIVHAMSNPT